MWQTVVGAALAALLSIPSTPVPTATAPSSAPSSASASASSSVSAKSSASAGRRFWVKDRHRYDSPWYAGSRRKMIGYGCTRAPYYDADPRCRKGRGFHHGLDLAMPCGTRLFAGFRGRVPRPSSAGAPGPAYGQNAFRIRNRSRDVDVVIGHARRVYVDPGDRVRKGQLVARASDVGAPDGCHLHFEVRTVGGGYQSALRPHEHLMLRR
jgi:murein DD-endopeptidase MepM/ murein hydrolase activator NlpD